MGIRGNWERRRVEAVSRLGEMDRRKFVKIAGASAAALVFGAGPFTEKAWAQTTFSSYPFSLGVASGDPRPDGVVLWTRLAPDPLNGGGMPTDGSVAVRWQVATDNRFSTSSIVRKGTVYAYPELAHSVHVEVGRLNPSREYFYRFKVSDGTSTVLSPTGRTKTAPAVGASVTRMAFAFVSCQMYEHGYFTAYRRMAEAENLDLVVHLGDYFYETRAGGYVAPGGNVRTHSGEETFSLGEYRNRHAQYKTDPDLQAAHKRFPFIVTWDDHEVENNYADEIPEATSQTPTREAWLKRRADAYQAYYEHMPLRRSSVPSGPDMLLYRRLAYGNLAEFNVLDTRQYRSDQPADEAQRKDPARTMTGAEQEKWLLDGLAASGATWNVLAQQTFFAQRDLDTSVSGQSYLMDAWDGYVGSRDRILNFVRDRRIKNPAMLSGDVHNNWACDLKADFANPSSQTLGVELVGTSVTSGGDGADTGTTQQAIVDHNPHIKFFNGQRGYVRCTLTPTEWRADYRVLPYVKQPGATISTRTTFTVAAGSPGLQLVTQQAPVGVQSSEAAIESDVERGRAQRQR